MHANRRSRARSHILGLLAVSAVSAFALWTLTRSSLLRAESRADAAEHPAGHGGPHAHAMHTMSAADMQRWVDDWYAAHPRRGVQSTVAAADTFIVFSFGYDNDGIGDEVDTARIFVGQTVLWRWTAGLSHTVTNGTGFMDPNAGVLFDQPSDAAHPEFAFQFTSAGTVPFFCRPHEGLMSGFVEVLRASDVVPISDRSAKVGFAADPSPNPTRDAAAFRFALGEAGHARVEVFDVRGRRVAVPVDRTLPAGTYAAMWDGRTQHGERVGAGVYYLRLTIPGASDSREVVVTR